MKTKLTFGTITILVIVLSILTSCDKTKNSKDIDKEVINNKLLIIEEFIHTQTEINRNIIQFEVNTNKELDRSLNQELIFAKQIDQTNTNLLLLIRKLQ